MNLITVEGLTTSKHHVLALKRDSTTPLFFSFLFLTQIKKPFSSLTQAKAVQPIG